MSVQLKSAIRHKYAVMKKDLTAKRGSDLASLEASKKKARTKLESDHKVAVKAIEDKYKVDYAALVVAEAAELKTGANG